jgi:hypothetical protein
MGKVVLAMAERGYNCAMSVYPEVAKPIFVTTFWRGPATTESMHYKYGVSLEDATLRAAAKANAAEEVHK